MPMHADFDVLSCAGTIPTIMARRNATLSDQLRRAIRDSGLSCYRICLDCRIDRGTMSRFMSGDVGLGLETLDRLVDYLELKLVPRTGRKDS